MKQTPAVLGIGLEEAKRRLEESGFADVEVRVSGRRREGRPRVIRLKAEDGKQVLTVSYFKELVL